MTWPSGSPQNKVKSCMWQPGFRRPPVRIGSRAVLSTAWRCADITIAKQQFEDEVKIEVTLRNIAVAGQLKRVRD
jgi:hypothetical protein